MNLLRRVQRHLRISRRKSALEEGPPFLILFVTSLCNMKCGHCFYAGELNGKDDLTLAEIFALSDSLGRIENLNLSGGEPFLRKELGEICRRFIRHNGVRQIYVPTNGYFTQRTIDQVESVLEEPELDLLVLELSLDGMEEFHDGFRAAPGSFRRAMQTYDALCEVQRRDPRLRIHAISTASRINLDEIRRLTAHLYRNCPQMDHHNLAIIRGDRRDASLDGPPLPEYEELFEQIRSLWAPREEGRYGAIVEPMLQWAKSKTIHEERQVVPCTAGRLCGVVYANGDVAACEAQPPLGNLRDNSFAEIWQSERAGTFRGDVASGRCYCTTEVFMWPSIVYQPAQLVRAMVGGRVWTRPQGQRKKPGSNT